MTEEGQYRLPKITGLRLDYDSQSDYQPCKPSQNNSCHYDNRKQRLSVSDLAKWAIRSSNSQHKPQSFTKEKRQFRIIKTRIPGPGSYNIICPLTKINSPKAIISPLKREYNSIPLSLSKAKEYAVGPGSYEINYLKQTGNYKVVYDSVRQRNQKSLLKGTSNHSVQSNMEPQVLTCIIERFSNDFPIRDSPSNKENRYQDKSERKKERIQTQIIRNYLSNSPKKQKSNKNSNLKNTLLPGIVKSKQSPYEAHVKNPTESFLQHEVQIMKGTSHMRIPKYNYTSERNSVKNQENTLRKKNRNRMTVNYNSTQT